MEKPKKNFWELYAEAYENDMKRLEEPYYSIDYSANGIMGTTTNAKCDQTDDKDHPDYGIPLNYIPNEGIVITPDAVFIKPLKLVVLTEDVYNKLKGKEDDR